MSSIFCLIAIVIYCIQYGVDSHSNCIYDKHVEHELEEHPEIKGVFDELEEHYHSFEKELENEDWFSLGRRLVDINDNALTSKAFSGILEVPVIIHVVYNTNYQRDGSNTVDTNVVTSNERITSQLLRLNVDFLGFNSESIPNGWATLKANYSMSFKLHKIIRKQASVAEYVEPNENQIFIDSPVIDRDHYLNIYVAPMVGGSFGFASDPSFPANDDATVMNYDAFGDKTYDYDNRWTHTFFTDGPFILDQGRTTTHEVGHWFFLGHTFGRPDTCDAKFGDDVKDTPNQKDATQGVCPSTAPESCGSPDMYVNFMDYTDGDCKALFTKGQLVRSISVLTKATNGRKTLTDYKADNEENYYINHIYFRVLKAAESDSSKICGPLDILMDSTAINTEISGKFIYGCYSVTNNKYVDVVTGFDVFKTTTAANGYDYCMETNLYKSNDARYLCYKKGGFTDNSRIKSLNNNAISSKFNAAPTTPTTSTTTTTKSPTASTTKAPTTRFPTTSSNTPQPTEFAIFPTEPFFFEDIDSEQQAAAAPTIYIEISQSTLTIIVILILLTICIILMWLNKIICCDDRNNRNNRSNNKHKYRTVHYESDTEFVDSEANLKS